LVRRAVDRLSQWPSLVLVPITGGRVAADVASSGRRILYLDDGDHARLLLTRPVITRMRDALAGCAQVTLDPGQEWIRMSLDTDGDVDFLLSLTSVAIKAHTQAPVRE
jgi:hypothetical protein